MRRILYNRNILKIVVFTVITLIIIGFNSSINATSTTNTKPIERVDTTLKSLSVDGYSLSPEFDPNLTTYYVVIPTAQKTLEVNAESSEAEATVSITGNNKLYNTDNTIKVVVKNKKESKTYQIIATRRDESSLRITSLDIEGATFKTEFNPDVFSYNIDVKEKEELKPLNITTQTNSEGATVEIVGNTSLKEGENTVMLFVKEGDDTVTYQLNANVTVEKTIFSGTQVSGIEEWFNKTGKDIQEFFASVSQGEQKILICLIAATVCLVLLIIVIIIKIRKRSKANKNREKIKNRAK